MKRCFLLALMISCLVSCDKSEDIIDIPIDNTPDSVFLLKSINGNFLSGQNFNFEYSTDNKLTKFYRPYTWARTSPCYVFYTNGRVSSVISEYDGYYSINKASMIFLYGSNQKCSKVLYKNPVSDTPNISTYFTNITDGNLSDNYDSLVYSASNQLQQIIQMHISNSVSKPTSSIKFFYPNILDSVANKLEYYKIDNAGVSILYDQLEITTTATDNPSYKLLWYFPFVFNLTYSTGNGGNVMSLPIIFDNPSTYLSEYLSFVPKCITNYKVYNTWGLYNYKNSIFTYGYSEDSKRLSVKKQGDPSLSVYYNFEKVRR